MVRNLPQAGRWTAHALVAVGGSKANPMHVARRKPCAGPFHCFDAMKAANRAAPKPPAQSHLKKHTRAKRAQKNCYDAQCRPCCQGRTKGATVGGNRWETF